MISQEYALGLCYMKLNSMNRGGGGENYIPSDLRELEEEMQGQNGEPRPDGVNQRN